MAIKQGIGCFISPTVEIDPSADVILGDHVFIAAGVRILAGKVRIGDYSKIHNNVLINPGRYVVLGQLSWIGQGSILDGTGGLEAGNFLGVGMNSALYSHIRHGDIMQGCNFDKDGLLIIGDDVWFVGQCLVSPIKAGNKSMAMLGSVVVKNMEDNNVYGGNPAINITNKTDTAYKELSLDEKMNMFLSYLTEYQVQGEIENLCACEEFPKSMDPAITYYNVRDRIYTKRNSDWEIKFNKWLFKYKAKFINQINTL